MIKKSNYIIASAGTGKTESLVRAIEKLIIDENVDISEIALITFTNKSTKEMRERLRQKLYEKWEEGLPVRDQLDKLYMSKISTIHTFCDDIIREYGLRIGISPNYKINQFGHELNVIIDEIVEKNYNIDVCGKIPTYIIKDILKNFYKETKDKGLKVAQKQEEAKDFWDEVRKYIFELYAQLDAEIEKRKREKNILTNNDLLLYAAKLVEDKNVATQIAAEIKYIFVDECQDINKDQLRLLEVLMDYVSLIIVGDEKQSIYAFRGSDKLAFRKLISKMQESKAEKTITDVNYRSNEELVKIFNKIFNSKFRYQKIKLDFENISLKSEGKKPKFNEVFNIVYNDSITEIIKKLSHKLDNQQNGYYNKIAILCRTNNEVNNVVSDLKLNGIDAEIYSSKSIYKSKAIIDLYKVLKYLLTNSDIELRELFYTDYYLSCIKFFSEDYLLEILEGFKYEIKKETINYVLNRVIEMTRIIEYYACLGKEQYIANVNRIKEVFRDLSNQGLSNIQIIDYLNTMIETQQMEPEPEIISKATITVSTIHTFKGLSSDIIVLYNADKNLYKDSNLLYEFDENSNLIYFNKNAMVLNNYSIKEDKNFENIRCKQIISDLEEEIRLFYVACTRAKEQLIIANKNTEGKIKYLINQNPNYVSYIRWILESKL